MKGRVFVALLLLGLAIPGGCAARRPVDQISDSGHRLYKLGDYAAAAEEFELIAARYPGDWSAQYMLGMSRLQLGQVAAARQALEIAHTRRPGDGDVSDALAEAMLRSGNEAELFAFLRERAAASQSVADYLRLGKYSMDLDDPDSARWAIDTAIQLDGSRTVAPYLLAADLAERLGDLEQAVLRLRQAYGIDPGDREVTDRLRFLGEVPGPTLAMPPGA